MKKFFLFETMISVRLIALLHAVGLFGILYFLIAISLQMLGVSIPFPLTVSFETRNFWTIVGYSVVGIVLWRVICEGWIVLFRVHNALVENTRLKSPDQTDKSNIDV